MTIEPYIKQYANAKKKTISKKKGIKNIDKAIKFRELGLITVDECIKMIADCIDD